MNYEYLSISELKPAERNARRHQEKDIEAIKKSIEEFGFNDPIGVWGPENTIVEGHGHPSPPLHPRATAACRPPRSSD